MNKILVQGSNNTIGDFFFTASPVAYLKSIQPDCTIDVALTKESKTDYLYEKCKFLNQIIKLEDASDNKIFEYGDANGYTAASLLLKNFNFLKNIQFCPLKTWYKTEELPPPNIPLDRYTLVHVTSSSNYNRPKIPYLSLYIYYIKYSGSKPLFVGTKKDEELFKQHYSDCIMDYDQTTWRFGKDSVFQTMSNISLCEAALVFSSWTTYASVFMGVPTLELWNETQHNLFNPLVKLMVGNPIHLLQNRFDTSPSACLFNECLPIMKKYSRWLYEGF